jgi:glycosyltransferase involved in cell wall biosynthesis
MWPELEILVVDDGSVDHTRAALEEMSGADLRIIRQSNAGPAAARNAAIRSACGEWIAFLDADDFWLPGKLSAQFRALEGAPDCAFSYADTIRRHAAGIEQHQRPRKIYRELFLDLLFGPEFSSATVIVRRSCFDRIGLFDSELRTGEDWDMWLRLADADQGCYVPQALCVYHVPDRIDKYPSELMELCTLRVLGRLFERAETVRRWPVMLSRRRMLYAWHYSVLAKTHLRQKKLSRCCRLSTAAVASHPAGAYFLARHWDAGGAWPVCFPAEYRRDR